MLDPVEFGKAMASIVRDAMAPLLTRIEQLEARHPQKGDPGQPGERGADAPPVSDDQIYAQVQKYLKENPPPRGEKGEAGEPGPAGKDPEAIDPREITRALLDSEELVSLVELRVKEAVAALPPPKDGEPGRDGNDGSPGEKGERGEKGEPGEPGEDGIGVAGAMIDRNGDLIITTSKGQAITLGKVIGRDGADFTEVSFDYDGERTFTIKGKGAELVKRVPIPLDRGYWRPGMACEKGDIVTEGGNAWIALRDTKVKPGVDAKEDWRLFARKGRDGRDGHNGIDKTAPVKIKEPTQ